MNSRMKSERRTNIIVWTLAIGLSMVVTTTKSGASEQRPTGSEKEQTIHGISADGRISFDQRVCPSPKDQLSLNLKKNTLTVTIRHARGIGQATLNLENGEWPSNTRIEFKNFAGLEGLLVKNGNRAASLFGSDGTPKGTVVSVIRKKKLIIAELPTGFLQNKHRQCIVSWVDFYR